MLTVVNSLGNCNAFDDGADGYCRADAVGSVILKRLEDAEADNDPIFGVIVGSTTNHCGQTDSITRPHEGDQCSVFRRIMRYTNYDPLDVGYIEMHVSTTHARLSRLNNLLQKVVISEFSNHEALRILLIFITVRVPVRKQETQPR